MTDKELAAEVAKRMEEAFSKSLGKHASSMAIGFIKGQVDFILKDYGKQLGLYEPITKHIGVKVRVDSIDHTKCNVSLIPLTDRGHGWILDIFSRGQR